MNEQEHSSLADQLTPLADRLRRRDGVVRAVSQVTLRLPPSGERHPFETARATVLDWMGERAGKPLPKEAMAGASFTLDEIGAQRTEAIAISEQRPRYWAARLDDADKNVPQRVWTIEIGLGEQDGGAALLGCRLLCVTRGADEPFTPSIPNLAREIVEKNRAEIDGRTISVAPWFIATEEEVDRLVVLLRNPQRRRDIIVFSLIEGSNDITQTSACAVTVAKRTVGAAHVAVVSSAASYLLSDRVGKAFSVYWQAVRTYRPGFDPDENPPHTHRIALAKTIAEWGGGHGPKAYEDFLISQTLGRSLSGAAAREFDHVVPSFVVVRRADAERKRRLAREKSDSLHSDLRGRVVALEEELQLAEAETKNAKEENDQLLEMAEKERDAAEKERDEIRAENMRQRARIESLENKLKTANPSFKPKLPENLDGFRNWSDDNLAGSVKIHNRAYQGIKKSKFEDISLIYESLLVLRDYYTPMKRYGGGEKLNNFKTACQELSIKEDSSFSAGQYGEQGDEYFVEYNGSRRLLDRHMKKGNAHDERICFRLYFFWDDEERQVVVGWLPSHLRTRIS